MAVGARRESGALMVLEATGFSRRLEGADLCITAEGSVDSGTGAGKAVSAVLEACRRVSVPCVVLGGTVTREADELYDRAAAGIFAIGRWPKSLADATESTTADLTATTRAICALVEKVAARGRWCVGSEHGVESNSESQNACPSSPPSRPVVVQG
jgi:glycerate kinase